MAEGSGLSAVVNFATIPTIIDGIDFYIGEKCIPGGTIRNWDSYGDKIGSITDYQKAILADPQTSGGLLISVAPEAVDEVKNILLQNGLSKFTVPVGEIVGKEEWVVKVV
jgi:selenide,water dikinase